MKIRVEHGDFEENQLILQCKELDEEMLEVLSLLRERSSKLTAQKDGQTYLLKPDEIFYAESVDGRNFLYTKDSVLETRQSLAQLLEHYGEMGFSASGNPSL